MPPRCYHQPRIIHRTHTCAILDAASLKHGNSKELQLFHNVAKQHLHALKVMKYETLVSFITLILELKLDQSMMLDWQWHTQSSKIISDYDELLEFLDLCATVVKNAAGEGERKCQAPPPERNAVTRPSYTASIDDNCAACKTANQTLYGCKIFYAFSTPGK